MFIRVALSSIALVAVAGIAQAEIAVTDLHTPGDNLAVRDTVSGFLWARFSVTQFTSVNTMLNTRLAPGGDLEGFSYATPEQIADMFRSAGAHSYFADYFGNDAQNLAACYHLFDVMGMTSTVNGGPGGPGRYYGLGFNSEDAGGGWRGISTIMIDGFSTGGQPPYQAYLSVRDGGGSMDYSSDIGHFLVMTPTPGAGAVLGLGGLAALRRRRA
jgi:MYXO-CTERM domain-containing protein